MVGDPAFVNGFVDGDDLVLLWRDGDGQMRARRRRAEWASFHEAAALSAESRRELGSSEYTSGLREEGRYARVLWRAAEWRRRVYEHEDYPDKGFGEPFEADVDPIRRYLADSGARVAAPRRAFLDIETDSCVPPALARQGKARVLCWCLYDDAERPIADGLLEADTDDAERATLERLWAALDPYDQVCAWFGDDFDFPVVRLRSEKLGAKCKDFRRWLYMDQMALYERMNKNSAESGEEKESLALDAVARIHLGEGKIEFDARQTWPAWEAGGERRLQLLAYCRHDTRLLPRLERKLGHLAINDAVCVEARVFADTQSANPLTYVDAILLRMCVERGIRAPSRRRFDEEDRKKFAGAYVMEPRGSGIQRDVHAVDFSGMYPSIMLSWNMSPETVAPDVAVNGPVPEGRTRSPATRVGFLREPRGMLPEMLIALRGQRRGWQKRLAAAPHGTTEYWEAYRGATSLKVIINACYGVTGSPFFRWFDRRVAESTSQTGVWLIQRVIAAAEERGMRVVYSDTDSSFFCEVSREQVAAFVEWCNADLLPRLVRESGCAENYVEIGYDKEYERIVFVSAKRYAATVRHNKWTASCACTKANGEPGAVDVRKMTCRDCGRVWDQLPPPRGRPEVKGLEYRRGDSPRLARKLQAEVIDKLMVALSEEPADFAPLVEEARRHVLEDALPVEEVSISKALSKSLREYKVRAKNDGTAAAEPPHVQVARALKARGEQIVEGTRVAYVVADGSASPQKVIPAVDYDGSQVDRHYIWESLVYSPTMRLLAAAFPARPGLSEAELLARDWERYALLRRTRPRKERARRQAAAPGDETRVSSGARSANGGAQGDLFAPQGGSGRVEVVAQAAPSGPYVVEVYASGDEREDARARLRLKEALRRFPGERATELRVLNAFGHVLGKSDLGLRVAASPELDRAVALAKAASDPAA